VRVLGSAKALSSLGLSFDRSTRSGEVLSAISRHVGFFPKLQNLDLEHLLISSESLIKFIDTYKGTLQNLVLSHTILCSGTWRDVILYLADELRLESLSATYLFEGHQGVSFRAIHRERPIIQEFWWIHMSPLPTRDRDEIDFFDSFQFVTRVKMDTDLYLKDGEGENLRDWLFFMADKYGLVHREPDIMY
jgi:hypothetical protein